MGIKCSCCGEVCYYRDEWVFSLGGEVVFVDERYPDWDNVYCLTCAEEKGLI